MLHHLAGATIQVANLVNYNCHPLDDGNDRIDFYQTKIFLIFQTNVCFASRNSGWIHFNASNGCYS